MILLSEIQNFWITLRFAIWYIQKATGKAGSIGIMLASNCRDLNSNPILDNLFWTNFLSVSSFVAYIVYW